MRALRSSPTAGRPSGDCNNGEIRLFVDASNFKPVMTGLRTYTRGLVAALASRRGVVLHVATSLPSDFSDIADCQIHPISARTRSPVARVIWREANLQRAVRRSGADVVICPGHEGPLRRTAVPTILVVHDVGPLVAPAVFGRRRWLAHWIALPRMCRSASSIVCVSNATLRALIVSVGVSPRKCVVIGEAPQVEAELGAPEPRVDVAVGPYVFYAGSMFPHKNVGTLVDTFEQRDLGPLHLRLAGPVREHQRPLVEAWSRRANGGRISHEGYVEPARLRALYAGAVAVALPSLYEGYGLTALEAMCSGTPVVATDLPPIRELCGDAAIYIDDPFDINAWAAAFRRVRDDAGLRDAMKKVAEERAAGLSWGKVADAFVLLGRRLARDASPTPSQDVRLAS